MRLLFLTIMIILGSLIVAPAAHSKSDPIYTPWSNNNALGGYDAVSFFDGKPSPGKSKYSFMYKGARWMFTTETALEKFKADPEAYQPQYGGYCAWAVARNKLAKGDPKFWRMVNGKLYLNFNARIQNRWDVKTKYFIEQADANWPEILDK